MRRWFSGRATTGDLLQATDELAALEDATTKAALVMNDDVTRALEELRKGTSVFHELGVGATLFWQAVLSFDKDIMAQATETLNRTEELAGDHLRMVHRDPTMGHQSKVYPPGSEYLLCQAQSQLLGAILGVLKESWTESLTGLNKLRKGYWSLQSLADAEKKYLEKNQSRPAASEDEDDLKPGNRVEDHLDFRTVTSDPIDLYVHSGVAMVWGIIKIALSAVPPALRNILSIFNFRGDREEGLRLIWDATDYRENIFGAIASLVTLVYHHIGLALVDIKRSQALPDAKLKALLSDLRQRYPGSQLWLTEEAREAASERDLERAVEILNITPTNRFPAIQGMRVFERALNLMFLHRFEETSEAFIECTKVNFWGPATYRYIAAASLIELYRDHKTADSTKAQAYAARAKDLLQPVPALARKKMLFGRQLPFDAFIATKLDKWSARAQARGCDLLDAVGVSPLEEMAYFWTGYRRMRPTELAVSLARLDACAVAAQDGAADEPADECAARAILTAAALRHSGRRAEALRVLRERVLCYTPSQMKACPHRVEYPLPVAHYELAVCLWEEAGGEQAEPAALRACAEEIEKAQRWETWDLEERLVPKLLAARTTLQKLGVVS